MNHIEQEFIIYEPRILLVYIASPIQWYNFVLADASFAHRAHRSIWSCFQPLM